MIDEVMQQIAAEVGGEVRAIDGGIALRASLFEGTTTFVDVQRVARSTFTPLVRARVHTTVVEDVPVDAPGLASLILHENVYALSGAWEWHADGVFGLTASVLMHGDMLDNDAVLLGPLLREHHGELQRCLPVIVSWLHGEEDQILEDAYDGLGDDTGGPFPVEELIEVLGKWTSVIGADNRTWRPIDHSVGTVELEAAEFAGLPVSTARRRLRLDRVAHPFGGWGWRVLADLREPIAEDQGLLVGSGPLAFARDTGTVVGAIVPDPEREGHAVAHVFLGDALLDALGDEGITFASRVAIGAAHAATVVDAAIVDFRSSGETASVRRVNEQFRQCFVRAAVGPAALDVGPALLDFLAMDRLRIGTAPYSVADRSFRWRPTAAVQIVTADGPVEDLGHVVTRVQVRSDLGNVAVGGRPELLTRLAHVNTFLPAMSMVIDRDDTVSLVSTWLTHEGIHHERQQHLAMIAALHATFGPVVTRHVVQFEVVEDRSLPMRDGPDDEIVDVGPGLAGQVPFNQAQALMALREFASRFGLDYVEDDGAAHALVGSYDGGGEAAVVGVVTIDRAHDQFYGDGYAVHGALLGTVEGLDDEQLNALTLAAHRGMDSSITVSWVRSPSRGVGAHLTIPASMIGVEPLPGRIQRLVECCQVVATAIRRVSTHGVALS